MPFLKKLLSLVFLLPLAAPAQNSTNYLDLVINTPLNFVLDNTSELENNATLSNALRINIKSGSKACYVYAKLNSITGNTSTPLTTGFFAIKFKSASHSNYSNLNTQDIVLTYSNQLLFQQVKTSSERSYYYDFKLYDIGYEYNPGTYGFTVQFTMTQP